MPQVFLRRMLPFVLFLLIAPITLYSQTFYASLTGVVTDNSGAVVPGATVVVEETATSAQYKTSTNGQGAYQVSFLKPGSYVVEVVDVKLQVGAESQVVTVSAEETTLDSINPQISTQLSSVDVVSLPENIGNKGANELLLASQSAGGQESSITLAAQ